MRLLLVGTRDACERLRAELDHTAITIAGEFPTVAAARASGLEADALLVGVGRAFRASAVDEAFEEPLTRAKSMY